MTALPYTVSVKGPRGGVKHHNLEANSAHQAAKRVSKTLGAGYSIVKISDRNKTNLKGAKTKGAVRTSKQRAASKRNLARARAAR